MRPALDQDLVDAYEERAAIMEYDAGLPRDEAERRARRDVLCAYNGQETVYLDAERVKLR